MTQRTLDNRYLTREVPETELLTSILEEGNLTDGRILALEGQLLTEHTFDVGQKACLCLVLGRAGWNRSEGTLRQMEQRFLKENCEAEAQAARLSMELLENEPDPRKLERAESGYLFQEPGQPKLYVEDPLAAHWHRKDRWGPPIRGNSWLQAVIRLDTGTSTAKLVESAMDGEWVLLDDSAQEVWRVSRAGIRKGRNGSEIIRWSRVRSVGHLGANHSSRQLALEVEGRPPQVIAADASECAAVEEFLIEMYRRTR